MGASFGILPSSSQRVKDAGADDALYELSDQIVEYKQKDYLEDLLFRRV